MSCPSCGITFQEFRKQGRLGCPNDYIAFDEPIRELLAKPGSKSLESLRVLLQEWAKEVE